MVKFGKEGEGDQRAKGPNGQIAKGGGEGAVGWAGGRVVG